MTVPPFDHFFRPVLLALSDGVEHKTSEVYELVKKYYPLDNESYDEQVPSGGSRYKDRVSWSMTYLRKGKLITSPRYGYQQITTLGIEELENGPENFGVHYLVNKYPDIYEYHYGNKSETKTKPNQVSDLDMTPTEMMDQAMFDLNKSLADELLNQIYVSRDWSYFEKLVLKVIQALGYGVESSSLHHTGGPGDEGIDGEIYEDKLGFNKICVQAKHYGPNNRINDSVVRNFIGSMMVRGINKGVLITTSQFTSNARKIAKDNLSPRLVLIDGSELVRLMIEYNIGVTVSKTYEIKRLDMDFFDDI